MDKVIWILVTMALAMMLALILGMLLSGQGDQTENIIRSFTNVSIAPDV